MKYANPIRILLLGICFSNMSFTSKAYQPDSLLGLIHSSISDAAKYNSIVNLIDYYLESDLNAAKKYIDLGDKYMTYLQPDEAFTRYYHLKADYYIKLGNFSAAQKTLLKSLRLDDRLGLAQNYYNDRDLLAVIQMYLGNSKKTISIRKSLFPLVKKLDKDKFYYKYFLNLGVTYSHIRQFDSARHYFQNAYAYTMPNTFHRAIVVVNLAFLNYNLKQFSKTIQYAKEAAFIARKLHIDDLYLEAITDISLANYELGKYDLAIQYSTRAMELAKQKKLNLQLDNAYHNLALAYEGKKDYKNAFEFEKEYVHLHDSLFNQKMSKQINELEIKYETEKKDKDIALKQNKIRIKNIELLSLLTGFLFIAIVAIFILRLYRKRNKAYTALVQKQMEIMACEVQADEEEKSFNKKYKDSSLSNELKTALSNKLEIAMKKDKVFLQPDLSLGKLAQCLGINSKYLSQAIHETSGESVTDFINRQRVNEASRLLIDPGYQHISVEGIAEIVGFGSKSTFNAAFKKFTGVTPSFFMNTAKTLSEKDVGKTGNKSYSESD